jgi:DNA repair protein RadA/Sms
MEESPEEKEAPAGNAALDMIPLPDVEITGRERTPTSIAELDRVLGGGIVRGSLCLVGGDPGIGKSTLLLQVAGRLGEAGNRVLYVSGEESASQMKLRADRLGVGSANVVFACETDIAKIESASVDTRPFALIVDSIQTATDGEASGWAGSVSQIRHCTLKLMNLAKAGGCAVFLVGHVTKQGSIAGPKLLEHMVDTVLYFEGERHLSFRILRAYKNRFGSTNEIGVFEMTAKGLVQVPNPSELFLSNFREGLPGAVPTPALEGTRPVLVEVQGLVSKSSYGVPQRICSGVERSRLLLVIAVLERVSGLSLGDKDIFANVPGGIKLNEPAGDLALAMAIHSSMKNSPIRDKTLVTGEVGLSGEVRPVSRLGERLKEASRMGFARAVIPAGGRSLETSLELIEVNDIRDAFEKAFTRGKR